MKVIINSISVVAEWIEIESSADDRTPAVVTLELTREEAAALAARLIAKTSAAVVEPIEPILESVPAVAATPTAPEPPAIWHVVTMCTRSGEVARHINGPFTRPMAEEWALAVKERYDVVEIVTREQIMKSDCSFMEGVFS